MIEIIVEGATQDLNPATVEAEVLRNLSNILSTPLGSVPGNRSFGIDMSFIDRPTMAARSMAVAAIHEAAKQEPRGTINGISFSHSDSGDKTIAKVGVVIDG